MGNPYKDTNGHFTSEENDGGECLHNGRAKEYRQNTPYEKLLSGYDSRDDFSRLKNSVMMEDLKQSRDIADYAKRVINGEKTAPKAIVGYIGDRERKEIEKLTGEPLNAKYHTISRNEILHIHNRHGVNGKADRSMANIDDYRKIIDAIHDFDEIDFVFTKKGTVKVSAGYADKNSKLAKLIQFRKKISEKTVYVVEAITDGKGQDIKIISAYQN